MYENMKAKLFEPVQAFKREVQKISEEERGRYVSLKNLDGIMEEISRSVRETIGWVKIHSVIGGRNMASNPEPAARKLVNALQETLGSRSILQSGMDKVANEKYFKLEQAWIELILNCVFYLKRYNLISPRTLDSFVKPSGVLRRIGWYIATFEKTVGANIYRFNSANAHLIFRYWDFALLYPFLEKLEPELLKQLEWNILRAKVKFYPKQIPKINDDQNKLWTITKSLFENVKEWESLKSLKSCVQSSNFIFMEEIPQSTRHLAYLLKSFMIYHSEAVLYWRLQFSEDTKITIAHRALLFFDSILGSDGMERLWLAKYGKIKPKNLPKPKHTSFYTIEKFRHRLNFLKKAIDLNDLWKMWQEYVTLYISTRNSDEISEKIWNKVEDYYGKQMENLVHSLNYQLNQLGLFNLKLLMIDPRFSLKIQALNLLYPNEINGEFHGSNNHV